MSKGKTTRLVFLDDPCQVSWLSGSRQSNWLNDSQLITLTAEVADLLEDMNIENMAACDLGALAYSGELGAECCKVVVGLVEGFEEYLTDLRDGCAIDCSSILSDQSYSLQISSSMVAWRMLLMVTAVARFNAKEVSVFAGPINDWFRDEGYDQNPWIVQFSDFCKRRGVDLEILRNPPKKTEAKKAQRVVQLRNLVKLALNRIRIISSALLGIWKQTKRREYPVKQVLFVGSQLYDWGPVMEYFRRTRSANVYQLLGYQKDRCEWNYRFGTRMRNVLTSFGRPLHLGKSVEVQSTIEQVKHRFSTWRQTKTTMLPIHIGTEKLDLFRSLEKHFMIVLEESIRIAAEVDNIAITALDTVKPDLVCCSTMSSLASKRLARLCRSEYHVPVVCYQHGGSYGTHLISGNELNEWKHADYFLTYGEIVKSSAEVRQTNARQIPVGSSRIMTHKRKHKSRVVESKKRLILWVAEFSSGNTYGCDFLMEDTRRYKIEKRGLSRLIQSSNVDIVYRPYRGSVGRDGTTNWIMRSQERNIKIDVNSEFEALLECADLVITTNSNGTIWNEVIATSLPMLLFCDPIKTKLSIEFANLLDTACSWCTTERQFFCAIDEIVRGLDGFVGKEKSRDRRSFRHHCITAGVSPGEIVHNLVDTLDSITRGYGD